MTTEPEPKPRHRLHVTKIVSIGAVEAGDNPGAEITFYKSAAPDPVEKRPAPRQTAAEHVISRLARMDERLERIAKIGGTETMAGRPVKIGPAGTPRGEIDRIALEKVEKGEADNLTQARPMAWKERPDLVEASRSASEGVAAGVRRGDVTPTSPLLEQIADAVRERALELSAVPVGDNWTASQAELRSRIWKTRDGQTLRALYTAAMSHGPRSKVVKGDEHAEARKILKAWQEDPAVGLR